MARNTHAVLRNLIPLSHIVKVYVPSTIDVDQEYDSAAQVELVQRELANWFGGATSFNAVGAWLAGTSKLVLEKVIIVQAYCSEAALEENIEGVVELCDTLKKDLRQEAIALEVDSEMYFI